MSTDRAEIETLLLKHQVESTEHNIMVRFNLQNTGSESDKRFSHSQHGVQSMVSRCCYYNYSYIAMV